MASAFSETVSVQKLKDGLYRVLWNTHSEDSCNDYFEFFSEIYLTNFGVDECYEMKCLMQRRRFPDRVYIPSKPSLKLTLKTEGNSENCTRRKITARFFGYEKEMYYATKSWELPTWKAQWTEIDIIGCPDCNASLDFVETFEIFIDMDPYHSTIPSSKKGQQSVLNHLAHLWESKILADVTFRCENKDIKAHICIVSSGSPVLAAMFTRDFKEKQNGIAVIKEVEAEVFEKLLYFLYTGEIDFKFKELASLMAAADMYNIASLKDECEQYLSKNVTVENATTYLILAHFHDAKRLYKATLNYMQQNSEAICARPDWRNLLKDHLELGFDAMQFIVKKLDIGKGS